jgi:hypothetical protein
VRRNARRPAGRVHPRRWISSGRCGRLDAGLDAGAEERLHELVRGEVGKRLVLTPERELGRAPIPVARPRRLEQGEAREPVRVAGRKRERGRASARVTNEVKTLPASGISLAEDAFDLVIEGVPERHCVGGVHLEILRDGVDVGAERVDQCRVREIRRKDAPGNRSARGRMQPLDRAGVLETRNG